MTTAIRLFIATCVLFYLVEECNCADSMNAVKNSSRRGAAFLPYSSSFRGKARRPCRRNAGRHIFSAPQQSLHKFDCSFPHQQIDEHRRRMSTANSDVNEVTPALQEEIYKDLQRLTTLIQEHDHLYYTPGLSPTVSDEEYDALTEREAALCRQNPRFLKRLEKESSLGSKVSRYGGRVGPIISSDSQGETGGKLFHLENSPMQSLDNAMMSTQVLKWMNRVRKILFKARDEEDDDDKVIEIIAEPKMDGLSLSLRYVLHDEAKKHYKLEWGATRGDGKRGENVTDAINAMDIIPKTFVFDTQRELPAVIEVRGEVVLPTSIFETLSNTSCAIDSSCDEKGDDDGQETNNEQKEEQPAEQFRPLLSNTFSNARNAASGILMRRKSVSEMKDEEVESTRKFRSFLRFYAYSIAFSTEASNAVNSIYYSDGIEMRQVLETCGFAVPNPYQVIPITLRKEEEVVESDCQTLFDYHSSVMSNRNEASKIKASDSQSFSFDFEVDGAVYKVSNVFDRAVLGMYFEFMVYEVVFLPIFVYI